MNRRDSYFLYLKHPSVTNIPYTTVYDRIRRNENELLESQPQVRKNSIPFYYFFTKIKLNSSV